MSTRTSNIDIRGLLRNALNLGVSIPHAISEFLDNVLSAGSTEVRLTILEKESVLIISDDGCGMNKEALEKSGCLHSRTESSADRHGRFGFGGNQAQITLTNLEGSVISLSSSDGNRISQITTDFPEIMVSGVYYPHAHGIETDSQHIWDEHAINRLGTGTIIQTHLPETKRYELSELIKSDAVTGLRFMIGTTYRAQLANGVKINIKINDFEFQIYPIDRLCSSAPVNEKDEYMCESHMIDVLQNKTTEEIVAHVLSDGKRRCLYKSTKKLVSVSELSDLYSVGRIKLTLAYSPNWNELQKSALEQNGITSLIKGQNGVIKFRELTNGTEVARNGKVIVALPKPPKKGGDKAGFKYHDDTRSRIEFDANAIMDDIFNIQVNKSKVNVDLIHPNIWKTIESLRYTFSEKCYHTLDPNKASAKVIQSSSSQRPKSAHNARTISTESDTSDSDSVSASDNDDESITNEDGEFAIVATSDEERVPIISMLNHKEEPAIVAAVPDEPAIVAAVPDEPTIVAAVPDDDEEPAIVAAVPDEPAIVAAVPDEPAIVAAVPDEPAIVATPIVAIESAIVAMPAIVPDSIREVKPSVQESIVRAKGEQILDVWKNSGKHRETLNETLDELHIAYSVNCAAKQLQRYLNGMHFENKYYLLIELIQERHSSPEDRMFKGIELLRKYSTVYGTDDVHDF